MSAIRVRRPLARAPSGLLSVRLVAACLLAIGVVAILSATASASDEEACDLAPIRERIDDIVSSITVERVDRSTTENVRGQPIASVDYALTGQIDGCVVLGGPIPDWPGATDTFSWMYDDPGISLQQEHLIRDARERAGPALLPLGPGDGNTSTPHYATSTFEAADGAGVELLYPTGRTQWNGKLVVIHRGAAIYPDMPPLAPRSPRDLMPQRLGANTYIAAAVDEGYAVAWLSRDAAIPPRSVSEATLLDGSVIRVSHHNHIGQVLAMTEFAQRQLAEALGAEPSHTFYYGHSSGPMVGRLINYTPGANVGHDDSPIIDGFLFHEVGAGFPLPILFEDDRDVLFEEAAQREGFVPQMDITGQLYVPWKYLELRRLNLSILESKGLGELARHYEFRELSHSDAGMASLGINDPDALDMSGVISSLLARLDSWVTQGVSPPVSRQDDVPGSAPAISLPEVACPLGVRFAPGGEGRTQFVPFDGEGLEPLDPVAEELGGEGFVDMNANGIRDQVETVPEAWRRLGLLTGNQPFNKGAFTSCLVRAAKELTDDGLLPKKAAAWYAREADSLLQHSGSKY